MRLITILIIILSIFLPLYPKFPLQEVEGTYVSIRVDDIVVALVVFVWFLTQLKKGLPILKERVFKLFVFYWLAGLIANISAFGITDLVSFKLAMLHWLRRVEYMSLFFVAKDAIEKKIDLKDLFSTIWLAFGGVFIYGMGQKYWRWPVISTMNEEFSKGILLYLDKWTRISATFAGHYDLAAWLIMLLCLAPAVIIFFKKRWQKVLIFTLSLMAFYLLILTASRVSFAAYLLGISLSLVLLKKHWWILPVLAISLFFGFRSKELNTRLVVTMKTVSTNIASLLARKPIKKLPIPTTKPPQITPTSPPIGKPKPTAKVKKLKEIRTWPTPEEAEAAAARSSNIRFQVEWPRAIRAFLKNPLLGTGYSSLGLATDNDYLRILGETGILGLLSFLLIIFHLFRKAIFTVFSRKGEWQLAAGFSGAMIGFLANGVFIDVFEASKIAFYFWMLMGVAYKISNLKFKISKQK